MPTRYPIAPRTPHAMVAAAFERLLYRFPAHRFDGLWVERFYYYIVWPERDTIAEGERSLIESWFVAEERMGTPPTTFVSTPPPGSQRLADRCPDDSVELRGSFRNSRDLATDLAIMLGPDVPPFAYRELRPQYELHFTVDLSQEQLAAVQSAVEALHEPIEITVVYPSNEGETDWFKRWPQGDIDIVPSRCLGRDVPRSVRWIVEEDEEYWLANRRSALVVGAEQPTSTHLPEAWRTQRLSCVIDASIYPPGNLRSYLTLYDVVTFIPPVEDRIDDVLAHMGVTRTESIELLGTGRLQVALPQSVDRYNARWLAEASEAHRQRLLPSRRLACAMLADSRRRMPFLGPDVDLHDRRSLAALVGLLADDSTLPNSVRTWFKVLNQNLADLWCFAAPELHRQGAMQASCYGLGWLAKGFFETITGLERTIEIMKASDAVELAGALGAVAVPARGSEGFEEEPYTNLLAAIGAPIGVERVPVADAQEIRALHGLLALDNDIPIVEFAKSFTGPDVDRLRALVRDLAAKNQDDDYLDDAVRKYNEEVRRYERRPNRVRTFNVAGFGASVATAAGAAWLAPEFVASAAPYASIGVWLLGVALARGAEPLKLGATTGRLWDLANGLLAAQPPRAVLLSRVRNQVESTKK